MKASGADTMKGSSVIPSLTTKASGAEILKVILVVSSSSLVSLGWIDEQGTVGVGHRPIGGMQSLIEDGVGL